MKQFLEHVERSWFENNKCPVFGRVDTLLWGFVTKLVPGSLFRDDFFQGLSVGKCSTTGKLFQPTIRCFPAKKAYPVKCHRASTTTVSYRNLDRRLYNPNSKLHVITPTGY